MFHEVQSPKSVICIPKALSSIDMDKIAPNSWSLNQNGHKRCLTSMVSLLAIHSTVDASESVSPSNFQSPYAGLSTQATMDGTSPVSSLMRQSIMIATVTVEHIQSGELTVQEGL
jgi:hypothetical protein